MEKIIILPEVYESLETLVEILYKKEYFGFIDSSIYYVDVIYDFIYTIPKQKRRKTLNPHFGVYYCQYSSNNNTTYYICFDIEDDIYLIKNVVTNHSAEYPKYIK